MEIERWNSMKIDNRLLPRSNDKQKIWDNKCRLCLASTESKTPLVIWFLEWILRNSPFQFVTFDPFNWYSHSTHKCIALQWGMLEWSNYWLFHTHFSKGTPQNQTEIVQENGTSCKQSRTEGHKLKRFQKGRMGAERNISDSKASWKTICRAT